MKKGGYMHHLEESTSSLARVRYRGKYRVGVATGLTVSKRLFDLFFNGRTLH